MTKEIVMLNDLEIGQSAKIEAVGGEGALRQHFLDMGLIPGAEVKLVKFAPMGDPMELLIHGYELTLRLDDAAKIEVTSVWEKTEGNSAFPDKTDRGKTRTEHPGLGEGGRYHARGDGDPLPSFQGEPERVILDAPGAEELADRMWAALNGENKVSLFVRYAALADGTCQDVIHNKHV